jgi:hypothetical protein
MVTSRSVYSPHYHIWTDALHGRRLAREATNEWDRGTYVRWAIASAWTAFEATCEHLTGASGLGNRFKDQLNGALDAKGWPRPDWGSGLWQDVLKVYNLRKVTFIQGYRKLSCLPVRQRPRPRLQHCAPLSRICMRAQATLWRHGKMMMWMRLTLARAASRILR